MIISGPHGTSTATGTASKDFVYVQVELDQALSVAKGSLMAWSANDYDTTSTDIRMNTRGLRVVVCPTSYAVGGASQGLSNLAGITIKDVPGNPGFQNQRGATFVLQVYGFHPALRIDSSNLVIAQGALLPSLTAAGCFDGPVLVTAPTGLEATKYVAYSFQTLGAPPLTTTVQGFIRGLM